MKKFPIIFFSLWFTFASLAQAQLDRGSRLEMWQERYEENPTSSLAAFNLGVSYHQKKKYKKALRYYRVVLRSKSKLKPVVYYYMSKAFLALGKRKNAKRSVSEIDIETLPRKLKARILAYKNSLYSEDVVTTVQKSSHESAWSGSFSLGYGMNTNPQFISADETSESEESEGQLSFAGALSYEMSVGDDHDFTVGYAGSGRSYSENSVSNYSSHNLDLTYNQYTSGYRFQFAPTFSHQTYSGKSFSNIFGGIFEVMQKFSSGYLSAGITYDSTNITEDDFDYLEGGTTAAYLQWKHIWTFSNLSLRYSFQSNDFQDSDSVSPSYDAHQLQLYYRYYKGSSSWTLGLLQEMREYTFDVTENDTRKDQRSVLYAYYGYSLTSNWTLYIDGGYTLNNSNFDQNNTDDKNYTQAYLTSGLYYRF